jgi:hypothetical protein
MSKKTTRLVLLATLPAALVIAARARLVLVTRRGREETATAAPLTYVAARARLRHCRRWHVVDPLSPASYFWVTQEPRQARELADIVLCVDRPDRSWSDRRGVIRVQALRGSGAHVVVDEGDSSYWRVLDEVYLEGDPALVSEVAAYLLGERSP